MRLAVLVLPIETLFRTGFPEISLLKIAKISSPKHIGRFFCNQKANSELKRLHILCDLIINKSC